MKISESWLREWINPAATTEQVAERLVMGGLELEIEPALAEVPSGVVVGRIVNIAPHPNAERLRVCEVDVGTGALSTIVCGAPNARAGLVAPCALPGARLPGGIEIGVGQLRGVASAGMLCSARELGLSDRSEGLLELDPGARPGTPIEQYLELDDRILNLELTPNRGDCLSILGLAREIGALMEIAPAQVLPVAPAVSVADAFELAIENPADCASFAGQVVAGLDPHARTPDWMRERLRKSGVRSIHPLVDITNYVMLELGQPLHAYDADRLQGTINARRARPGETVRLLNDQLVELSGELVIADARGPLGLAGAMGGAASAVSGETLRVLFESAAFPMQAVAGIGRRHKLASDALYRFERGVDPAGQRRALDRAARLAVQICAGQAGPVVHAGAAEPAPVTVALRHDRLTRVLGHSVPASDVERLLGRLEIRVRSPEPGTWRAEVPSYRHDLRIEADLIEEVARLYGYERFPARAYAAHLVPSRPSERRRGLHAMRDLLAARGWQETVGLAFAEPEAQRLLAPETSAVALDNPLAGTQSELRATLWPGLLRAWRHNRGRQVERVRLFEAGVCFEQGADAYLETSRIAGLAAGPAAPEQWALARRPTDFFDVKADVEALLSACEELASFEPASHPALHPGQSARVCLGAKTVGWIGTLHPRAVAALDLGEAPILFELDTRLLAGVRLPAAATVSEFPSSRRDLALIVPETLRSDALVDAVREAGGDLLREVVVFDVYRGSEIPEARKSMALGLIFQERSRTLAQEDVDAACRRIVAQLQQQLGASVRG